MNKKAAFITVLTAAALVGLLTVLDLVNEERTFSQTENRILASRPEFSVQSLFSGEYTSDYENYVTDQFVARDGWIGLKTYADLALGKKEVNGVYLAGNGEFIEQHKAEEIDEAQVQEKIALLQALVERYEDSDKIDQVKVLLAPTADNVLTEELPAFADYYDQTRLLDQVKETVGEEHFVEVLPVLEAHHEEYIYYKTDHHWTTLGAHYAYQEWAADMGLTPVSFTKEDAVTVAEEFLGTLHSKVNIAASPDTIQVYGPSLEKEYSVYYDLGNQGKTSIYEKKHLDTKNKYGYFLDDNHGFVQIETGVDNGRTLLVIKDSYANCFVPFALEHYETVCIIDLRYCNMRLYQLIDQWTRDGNADLLVLYNVIHFIQEFKYL